MRSSGAPFLGDFWYLALPGARLRPGQTLAKRMLGQPLLLGRTSEGAVFALRDLCPHRAMPLRYGRFDGREITCAYHGWRFGPDGRCRGIPALAPGQEFDLGRIRAGSLPCREIQGNLWVYFAAGAGEPPPDPPEVPALPAVAGERPRVTVSARFPCDLDHAAFALMDPAHAPFVHTSWWWKRGARRLRLKEKRFEPAPLGWRMARHDLPPENRIYRLLGPRPSTEITYRLPGLRIEQVEGGRHGAVALTALTPVDENETEVHQCLYWSPPWLAPLQPVIRRLAQSFLEQDRVMAARQRQGLASDPALMLVGDADAQARWFHQLKREWLAARAEGRPFRNPVEPVVLRWYS